MSDEFRATGYEPTGFTLFSYATVQALAEGVRCAGKVGWRGCCGCPAHWRSSEYGVRPNGLQRKRDVEGMTYEMNVSSGGRSGKLQ
jgi:branched-chain amino acid transport system substrate-binding protein